MNQNQFLLDSGFWGWLYKLLYPVEWLMTQIMAVFHKFLVMLGMNEIGFSWVMSNRIPSTCGPGMRFSAVLQVHEGYAQDAGPDDRPAAKDAAYPKQIQGQERSRQQGSHAARDDEALPGQ